MKGERKIIDGLEHWIQNEENGVCFIPLNLCKKTIKLLKEHKTGTWRRYEGVLTCSECNTGFYDEIMGYCGDKLPRFCPWCGADMRDKAVK